MKRSKKSKYLKCVKYFVALLLLIQVTALFGQVPQYINYQGLAKETDGGPIRNTEIGIQISILNEDFTSLYAEIHFTTTTDNGIYAIKIGDGTILEGDFAMIDWISGTRYIQVELDADGDADGQSFELMGRSQILSVPYALVSDSSNYATQSGESASSKVSESLTSGYIVEESRRSHYADSAGFATSLSNEVVPIRSSRADSADYASQSGESANSLVAESLITGYVVEQRETSFLADSSSYSDSTGYASISGESVTAQIAETLASDYIVEQSKKSIYADSSSYADSSDYANLSEESVTAQIAEALVSGYIVDQAVYADTAEYVRGSVDMDDTNEIQSLSFEDDQLSISGSNSVAIPIGSPKIQQSEEECVDENAGLLRFEPTRKVIQYCDGEFWVDMNAAPLSIASSEVVDAICESSSGSVTINFKGGQHPVSVEWSNGLTHKSEIENLSAGNYSVKLTDGAGRELSQSFVVASIERTINIGTSNIQPNTICGPNSNDPTEPDHNGQITLSPTSDQQIGSYTFSLMTSDMVAISSTGSTTGFTDVAYVTSGNSTTVTGLPASNYLMTVSDNESLCEISFAFSILAAFTGNPVIDPTNFVITSNSSCDPDNANGIIDASRTNVVTGGTGNYRYEWTTATDPSVIIDHDEILDAVSGGEYMLRVIDDQTGCTGTSQAFTIDEDPSTITAGVSGLSNNMVCDGANNNPTDGDANGSITFTPQSDGIATGNYTFALETAGGIALAHGATYLDGTIDYNDDAIGNTSTTVTGLDGGNYVMNITDLNNQCFVTHVFTIADNETDVPGINVSNIITVDNTTCNGTAYTGQADASASNAFTGGTGDYRYEWANSTAPGAIIDNDGILDGVPAGEYILTVIDDQTGCVAAAESVTISETLPEIAANESALTDNTVCNINNNDTGDNDANGAVTFTPDTDGAFPGTYTFALKTSGGTAIRDGATHLSGVVSYDDDATGSASTTVTGLSGGNYIMTITDLNNHCMVERPFTIVGDDTDLPAITLGNIVITNNTTCDNTSFNGQANASGATAVTGGTGDYRYEWLLPLIRVQLSTMMPF